VACGEVYITLKATAKALTQSRKGAKTQSDLALSFLLCVFAPLRLCVNTFF
jgi:hypothetical protein